MRRRDRIVRFVKRYMPLPMRRLIRAVHKAWGYRGVLLWPTLSLRQKLDVIARFIRIDLNVPVAHAPGEIVPVCRTLLERRPVPGEVMVEAGCWEGASTAKFSIICGMTGYPLYVYDSFEGVEPTDQEGWDYSGQYAASRATVETNIRTFGDFDACSLFPGWFVDTLAAHPLAEPVRTVFIDCDLAKGTVEVLQGILPSLSPDGIVYTQDYHIPAVRKVLHDSDTWKKLGREMPAIRFLYRHLAAVHW